MTSQYFDTNIVPGVNDFTDQAIELARIPRDIDVRSALYDV